MKRLIFIISLLVIFGATQAQRFPFSNSVHIAASESVNMVSNGTFDNTSSWSVFPGWSIGSGVAETDGTAYSGIYQSDGNMVSSIAVSTEYTLTFTVVSASGIRIDIYNDNATVLYTSTQTYTTAGSPYSIDFTTASDIDGGGLGFKNDGATNAGTLDNISLKLK